MVDYRIRGFEVVKDEFRKNEGEITLPSAGTKGSAAYDFYSPVDITIQPHTSEMIWTDVKAYFREDEALLINVRSSMGKHPVMLANTQGWIDSTYFENPDNDGNIGLNLFNLSDQFYRIKKGDRIAQGMFIKRLSADVGDSDKERLGGFGSTGK